MLAVLAVGFDVLAGQFHPTHIILSLADNMKTILLTIALLSLNAFAQK